MGLWLERLRQVAKVVRRELSGGDTASLVYKVGGEDIEALGTKLETLWKAGHSRLVRGDTF